jgi:hypothetical protein
MSSEDNTLKTSAQCINNKDIDEKDNIIGDDS